MTTEIIEGEVIEAESRALAVTDTVSLPIPVEEAVRQWEQYQELTRRLLDDTDYQAIGGKKFKKKSAWRKYARAFNITDRVTHEEIVRTDDGFPKFARIRVEARALNGRTAEADQECHVKERCCQQPCSKKSWKSHDCCAEDCNGQRHWSHPGDLPATALTRAKNRAISDLIGAGEVSAEEMDRPALPAAQGWDRAPSAAIPPPPCPTHGTKFMSFRKAGTSKNTGNPYGAFWTCGKDCNKGKGGKSWTMFDEEWQAQLQLARGEAPAKTQDEMDVPPHDE